VLDSAAALVHNGEAAFDLSDRLPAEVRAAFESGALDYVQNRGVLDAALSHLDEIAAQQ
jgi:hypothetical protein